jgi:tRNA threonylcarbamoyl adenosine modification protein YjeE
MTPARADFRLILWLPDEAATARLAQDVAAVLKPGDLIALSGGLGAGKTSFARALIRALANEPAVDVPSPTFALRIDHALPRLNVVHADLYRIGSAEELEEIGLQEALSDSALLVEWPEMLPPDLSEERLDIALEIAGSGRRAEIRSRGTWAQRLQRTQSIRKFLDVSGWVQASRHPLIGDASVRAYERILSSSSRGSAILMNAPARSEGPQSYNGRSYDAVAHRALDIRPFVAIDLALMAGGVRVPEIFAADLDQGLLLLEDLGAEGILDAAGRPIMARYEAAVDLLSHMHAQTWPAEAPLPGGGAHRMPHYDREALLIEISLFPDWFRNPSGPAFSSDERADFLATWRDLLDTIASGPRTWVLRDFHSPNILWQRNAEGIARVGVIDFQDALIGHPAYDVASLAQDARSPLTHEQEIALKARYLARRGSLSADAVAAFEKDYAVLAAQRATKVLGAFTRLAAVEGKPAYQRHLERLKSLLRQTLRHPVLSGLRVWYERHL